MTPMISTKKSEAGKPMKIFLMIAIQTLVLMTALSGCAGVAGDAISPVLARGLEGPPRKTMRPFRSEQELATFLKELAQKQQPRRAGKSEGSGLYSMAPQESPAAPLAKAADDSVTNVQHAGVDEG